MVLVSVCPCVHRAHACECMCILIAYVPTSQAQPAQAKLAAQRPVPRQVCAGDLSRDGMIPSGLRSYAGKEHCHNQALVSWHLDLALG